MSLSLSKEVMRWLTIDIRITNAPCGIRQAVIIQPFHDRTIFFKVKPVELILEVRFVFRGDIFDEVDILIRMKGCERLLGGMNVI